MITRTRVVAMPGGGGGGGIAGGGDDGGRAPSPPPVGDDLWRKLWLVVRRPFFPFGGRLLSPRAALVLLLASFCVAGLAITEAAGMAHWVSKLPLGWLIFVAVPLAGAGWLLFAFLLDSLLTTADMGFMYGLPMAGDPEGKADKRAYLRAWGPMLARVGVVIFSISVLAPEIGKLVYEGRTEELRKQANAALVSKHAATRRENFGRTIEQARLEYVRSDSLYRCEVKGAMCDALTTGIEREGPQARRHLAAAARADTLMRRTQGDSSAFEALIKAEHPDSVIAVYHLVGGLANSVATRDSIYDQHFKGDLRRLELNNMQWLLAFLVFGLLLTKLMGGQDLAIYTSTFHQELYSGPYMNSEEFNELLNAEERHPNFGGKGLTPTLFVERCAEVAKQHADLNAFRAKFAKVRAHKAVARAEEREALQEIEWELQADGQALQEARSVKRDIVTDLAQTSDKLARAIAAQKREERVVAATRTAIVGKKVDGDALVLAYEQLSASAVEEEASAMSVQDLKRRRSDLEVELEGASGLVNGIEADIRNKLEQRALLKSVDDERRRVFAEAARDSVKRQRPNLKVI